MDAGGGGPVSRLRAARTKRQLAGAEQASRKRARTAQTVAKPPEIHGWKYCFDTKVLSGEVHNYPGQPSPAPITTSEIVHAEGDIAHTHSGSRYKLADADPTFAWQMRGHWANGDTSLASLLRLDHATALQSGAEQPTSTSSCSDAEEQNREPRWFPSNEQLNAALQADARDPEAIFGSHDYLTSPTSDSVSLCPCKQTPCVCGMASGGPLLSP